MQRGRIGDQVADFNEAKKFADAAFNPKYEVLVRNRDEELAAASNRMAALGSVASSGMARLAAQIYAATIEKALHARTDALLEGVELHDVELDDAKDAILKELEQRKVELVRTYSDSLEKLAYLQRLGMGAYLGSEMENAGNRALGEIRANIERRRLRKKQAAASQNVTNVYHVAGHNVRFNTNSTDNSVNIVSISQEEVFATLKQQILEKMPDDEQRSEILRRVESMAQVQGTRSFAEKYTDFISAAANHISIIGPFIPALSEMLKRALS